MSNFKLKFTLKQHTPLIHFQADQSGATLRATELKPKLDRFLLNRVPELKSQTKKHPNGSLSLDYKVKIKSENDIRYYLPLPNGLNTRDYNKREEKAKEYLRDIVKEFDFLYPTLFFANADKIKFRKNEIDENKSKKDDIVFAILDKKPIQVTIISFNTDLLDAVKENISSFFAQENFGTRQNKGFGSFTVETINQKKQDNIEIDSLLEKNYKILNKFNSNNPLKEILNFYQDVKSGSKIRKTKSELMKYFFTKNKRWEKRWIKRKLQEQNKTLFNDLKDDYHENNDYNFEDDEKYFYLRALLGITGKIEFLTKNRDKIIVSIEHNEPIKNKKIERFASPILFKVINNDIYVLMKKEKPLHREILNKSFTFTASYKDGKEKTILKPDLKTPDLTDDELIKMYENIFGHKQNKKANSNQKKRNRQKNFNNPFESLKDLL